MDITQNGEAWTSNDCESKVSIVTEVPSNEFQATESLLIPLESVGFKVRISPTLSWENS